MTPLKVYVAGSSAERHERSIPVIAALKAVGIEITHDWTIDMQQFSNAASSDENVPDEVRLRCANDDFNAIRQAHFVLFLSPDQRGSSGAWSEFGFACGMCVPIVVTGTHRKRTIFTSKADVLFETDQEGIDYLVQLHRRRMARKE